MEVEVEEDEDEEGSATDSGGDQIAGAEVAASAAAAMLRSAADSSSASKKKKNMVTKTITVTTLDDVLADNGYSTSCPEFVRITEYGGEELSVLQGSLATLACTKLVCVTGNVMRRNDNMPFAADVISFLNDHGFAIYNTYENTRVRFFNVQIEMLFVKKDIMDEMFEVGFKSHLNI
jgi:hypothetical protein